jgi:PKHD-type hydroxylase
MRDTRPNHRTDTFQQFDLWDTDFCQQIIETALLEPVKEARLQDQGKKMTIRNATGHGLDPHEHPNIAIPLVDKAVSNPWGFKLYADSHILSGLDVVRYEPGDYYRPHTDWGGSAGDRKISLTVQLSPSENYKGGNMLLHDGPDSWVMDRTQGTATFFPSWTLHEVKPVMKGERWALVAFFCGPPYC